MVGWLSGWAMCCSRTRGKVQLESKRPVMEHIHYLLDVVSQQPGSFRIDPKSLLAGITTQLSGLEAHLAFIRDLVEQPTHLNSAFEMRFPELEPGLDFMVDNFALPVRVDSDGGLQCFASVL